MGSNAAQTTVAVPFVDLRRSHAPIAAELLDAIGALVDSSAFTNGPAVAEFEQAFATYCGTAECVGVASGFDAIELALRAAGLEEGDEVIVPAHTFVATAAAVLRAGGVPVLADVSELDYGLDAAAAAAAATPRTRFLLPVHLYGQMCDVAALRVVAREHELAIVEDACQAHGATRDGITAGRAGLAAAFSFYPGKNLGALGDAGAVTTDDPALAETIRALREHGQRRKYRHDLRGCTSRLDTIQAIALGLKLPLLAGWNEERREAARFYTDALDGVGDLRLPEVAPRSEPVWHLYVVRTADPDTLGAHLREHEIGSGRHYPEAVHLSAAYRELGDGPGSFPVAEALAAEGLSLPIFPGITELELTAVVDAVRAFFDRGR